MYKEGQRILERQRFAFPPSWLYVDNIEGEWGAFNDILKRKDSSIQTQVNMTVSNFKSFLLLKLPTCKPLSGYNPQTRRKDIIYEQ